MAVQPVILTTSKRPSEQVTALVSALSDAAGLAEPIIFDDHLDAGAATATRDALRAASAAGEHVLFLEDDVVMDRDAPARIAATSFPAEVAVISFCDMREVAEFAPSGLYRRSALGSDNRGWWGNQALLIHRDTVAMCARADWFGPEVESSLGVRVHKLTYGDDGRNCSDIRLALLIHLHGGDRRDYAVHVPSLFNHVGHDSACFPGRSMGERATRNWIGDRRRFGIDAVLDAAAANP